MKHMTMMGKSVKIEFSAKAERELRNRKSSLYIEMELYFSCLLRKQVRVYEKAGHESGHHIGDDFIVKISDKLCIGFRPVMTKSCSVFSCAGEKPTLSDFPIEKPDRYIPHWLKLDYRKGEWQAEFGYLDG